MQMEKKTTKLKLNIRIYLKAISFSVLTFLYSNHTNAQCVGAPINTFPYSEGFESSPAWTIKADSLNSDWAWGTPSHPTINSAGGGTKCWSTGSLTGSFYKYKQISSLESPCFDFTTLSYPWISLKIFWEDEWKYDGMCLQSSLDGGLTWANVGAPTDPTDCLNTNWYNDTYVTWLDSAKWKSSFGMPQKGIPNPVGWAGRIGATSGPCQGGHGSGGWVTATHCLVGLANQPSVRFRFIFGAGTTCNSYDGIAIDDILIQNAPVEVPNFSAVCSGANSFTFTNLSTPCTINSSWSFGDPGSGASNNSVSTNPSHTFSAPGTYTVTLVSSGTCNAPATISIPVSILSTSITPVEVTCNGNNDGSATAVPAGGSGPFTYSWSPGGQTTSIISSLAPGTYTVAVSEANACPVTSTIIITQPGVLSATATPTSTGCASSTGTVTISGVTGGTGPYSYNFNNLGLSGTTVYNNLGAGTYSVVVQDVNGCTYSTSVSVSSSTGPSITSSSGTASLCNAACTGSANVSVSGGTAPLTYSWSPNGGAAASTPNTLCAGTYTCTITDANGCLTAQTVTLTDPPLLVVSTASITPAACNTSNGSAVLNVTGGTPAYTFSWSGGGGTKDSISAVPAGSYTVSVTDANNCPSTYTVSINNNSGPSATLTSSVNPACNAVCSGQATINATGGTAPLTYSWSPSGGNTTTASGLCQGGYTCTITDANNCITTQAVTITQPGALAIAPSSTAVACSGGNTGTASVAVTGGTTGYTYSWSPSGGANSLASGLTAGNYTCIVVDANGCKDSTTINITQPLLPISSSAAITGATCGHPNGLAYTTTSGGSPGYTYSWSSPGGSGDTLANIPSGTYTCMITDAHGCSQADTVTVTNTGLPPVAVLTPAGATTFCHGDSLLLIAGGGGTYSWSTGATTDSIMVNTAGTYTVSVTNVCGTNQASTSITVTPPPIAAVAGSNWVCSGDSVMLTASGGNTFTWSTGSNAASIYVSVQGTYTVQVSNGCGISTATSVLTVNSVTANFSADSTLGYAPLPVIFTNGSSANTTSWFWSFGDGATSTSVNPSHTYGPGTYTALLTVTDSNGCKNTYKEVIIVHELPSWIWVPNIFTPNGDGKNEIFQCGSQNITAFEMRIYDRWGLEMANINTVDQGWDGRTKAGLMATDGTYYYIIHAKGGDGKVFDFKGYLQLIR